MHTHTGKTGAGSDSNAGCNVNKWAFSHAAGPAELPARQICVPDWNSTSWTPHKHLLCAAYQFQCTALQLALPISMHKHLLCAAYLNLSVPGDCFKCLCMKPTRCYLQSAVLDIKLTTGSGNAGTCENLHDRSRIRLREKAGVCASALTHTRICENGTAIVSERHERLTC